MASFVEDYFATAPSDPKTSWRWLTSDFQEQSGGYGRYKGFWSTIQSADLSDVSADPEAMTVSYTVTYTKTDGSTSTENHTLGLAKDGDQYYVASES
jgi:hypothetical protein